MSRQATKIVVTALLALSAAGCGSQQAGSAASAPAGPASTAAPQGSTPATTNDASTGGSGTGGTGTGGSTAGSGSQQSSTGFGQGTSSGSQGGQPTAQRTSTSPTGSSATPTASQSGGSTTSTQKYLTNGGAGEGLYFTSGPLHCGITDSLTGCQSTSTVANLPTCDNPDDNEPYVTLGGDGASCTNQGVFFVENGHSLPVGATLTRHGTSCTVRARGSVRCTSSAGTLVASSRRFAVTTG